MNLDFETHNLITAAKLGSKDERLKALEKLFRKYQDRILRIVRLRSNADLRRKLHMTSWDVRQEVFLYALKSIDTFEPKSQGHFINWLSQKVGCYLKDRLDYIYSGKRLAPGGEFSIEQGGKSKGNETTPLEDTKLGATISKYLNQKMLIDDMLDTIDNDSKELIIKHDLEKFTFKEIGEEIGKPEEAVRKQYTRAKQRLIDNVENKFGTTIKGKDIL
ncbi:MAG: sigma-70 family RNA polymerase sigma factor [Candidatus Omnitrophica bacterium]|nr:sigma-70 family RNA polymerase sigma factor [Candidatus Omnitrophota bacterium]